ncbi:MAG: GGDEF domain-containing protein [Beggiatoa sp. IS2]|nr:MAG: GGDEF domain-containing protein [Beggiatoa sp. IS2]
MPSLNKELTDIISGEKLTPYFQPIVSLAQKKIIGYEALIRGPSDSPLHSAFNLFDTAERFNLSTKLEFICRELTIQRYASLKLTKKLFINVSASVLLQPDFENGITLKLLDKFGIDPHSIVIELTEHQPTDDYELMHTAVLHYRNMGFEIALDDLGAGYSGLTLWSKLLPEYVKIDNHFVHGIDEDAVKFNFVRSIQNIASSLHCNVIAEGVETESEFKAIAKLGITHAQGYYFARPSFVPIEKIEAELFVSEDGDDELANPFGSIKTVSCIAKLIVPTCSDTTINEVMTRFQHNSELSILPLVDNNIAVGIICRDQFLSKLFASRYGLELYGKKAIKLFIDKTPVSINENMSIEAVSNKLTAMLRNDSAFIITHKSGEYVGVGTVMDLLREITHEQIENAKHANPLTLLPGSVPINKHINRLLTNKTCFSVAYFDLDNFKPFNDVYGYNAGDNIIKAVAQTLSKFVQSEKGLVGHIGGDDFIVIFTCEDWLDCCKAILKEFKNLVPSYYKTKDVKAGGIHTENRAGQKCFYPLVSLSVGIVDETATAQCQSHVEIADLAAGAKKQAKKIEGNSFFVNKRIPFVNGG